jgi:hypothetical protein
VDLMDDMLLSPTRLIARPALGADTRGSHVQRVHVKELASHGTGDKAQAFVAHAA